MKDENKNPWGPNKGVPKDQEWLKLTKILYFFNFAPIQITQATNCHYFYADLMQGEYNRINKRMWIPGGSIQGSWMAQNGQNWPKYHFFGSYPTHLVNKFPFLSNWSNVGRIVESDDPGGPHPGVLNGPKWLKGPQDSSSRDQFLPFLDLRDPLAGPQGSSYSSIIFFFYSSARHSNSVNWRILWKLLKRRRHTNH